MPDTNTEDREQKYKCRVHNNLRTLAEAKNCKDYQGTKCNVYRHICSVWNSYDASHAQSPVKFKGEQEKFIDEQGRRYTVECMVCAASIGKISRNVYIRYEDGSSAVIPEEAHSQSKHFSKAHINP